VVGWIKRGPVGLLGSNKQDARETVDAMLADAASALSERGRRARGSVIEFLGRREVRHVSYADWLRIDAKERQRGAETSKIREKFATVRTLLEALSSD
jgi:ferredoxin--NADP+ reductase